MVLQETGFGGFFYLQKIHPDATQRDLIRVSRITTILLFLCSSGLSLMLTNALQLFDFIIMFGAGTGLIFILRWFWWRINAWSEIAAIFSSGIISIIFTLESVSVFLFGLDGLMPYYMKFPMVVVLSTFIWLLVTYMTDPENKEVLINFYQQTNPGGPGGSTIVEENKVSTSSWSLPSAILALFVSLIIFI